MNELNGCTKHWSRSKVHGSIGVRPRVFYSILDVKEHPVNVLRVSTLQYIKLAKCCQASFKPENNNKIFCRICFTFKSHITIKPISQFQLRPWKILWIIVLLHYYMILSHKSNYHLSPCSRSHTLLGGQNFVLGWCTRCTMIHTASVAVPFKAVYI